MATEIIERKLDDLDLKEGGPDNKVDAIETVTFLHEGETFRIDLSAEHYSEYTEYMTRLANAGRIVMKSRPGRHDTPVPDRMRKARGRSSPYADYRRGMREYFEQKGQPIKSYKKQGTDKPAGYKYKQEHYVRYNEYLRSQGREEEILVDV